MADYFIQFSCMFDVGTADNAAAAMFIRDTLMADLEAGEEGDLGFDVDADPGGGPGALWIRSDGHGDPEHVITFVLRCADAFDLTGRWGFAWALTCSKPRLDSFGGGAQLIDLGTRRSLSWIDCSYWLGAVVGSDADPAGGVVLI